MEEVKLLLKKFKQCHKNMVSRCTNPKDKKFKYYKKVGITPEWLMFDNFTSDMFYDFCLHAARFGTKETTIEREDNKKGYAKSNCVWATWDVQRKNTRRTIKDLKTRIPITDHDIRACVSYVKGRLSLSAVKEKLGLTGKANGSVTHRVGSVLRDAVLRGAIKISRRKI